MVALAWSTPAAAAMASNQTVSGTTVQTYQVAPSPAYTTYVGTQVTSATTAATTTVTTTSTATSSATTAAAGAGTSHVPTELRPVD
ncbi:MAG TPA: hypothetical protein VL588_00105 [Bdellovibrionota bacterium]|nr:hypothetical protein [Bdellovibrionota bacterium]